MISDCLRDEMFEKIAQSTVKLVVGVYVFVPLALLV